MLSKGAADWMARMLAVEDAVLRAHHLSEELATQASVQVVELLGEIQEATARGDAEAGRFLMTLQHVLTEEMLPYERTVDLYKAAALRNLTTVQRLLLAPPARQATRKKGPRKPPEGHDTLGMRTWKARTTTSAPLLDRLCTDTDATVIRNVLLNGRITEKHVITIASRRPIPADVLMEIARQPRWNRRHAVRRALVFNPYTPTETALRLLPFMSRTDLKVLKDDRRVHEEIARQAAVFITMRPPQVKAAQQESGLPSTMDAMNDDEEPESERGE